MKAGAGLIAGLIFCGALAGQALGQSAQDKANTALGQTPSATGLLTDQKMQEVVVPFETANPDATTVNQFNMEDRAFNAQYQGTDEARAYGAMKDSALTRPEVSLGSDPLSLADDAVQQASSVVGGLFSADEGSCSEIFQGGKYNGYQLCNRILSRRKEVCTETRSVTVDREDQWRCSIEAGNYSKRCNQAINWSCTGTTGHACIQQAVSYSKPVTWIVAGVGIGAGLSGRSGAVGEIALPAQAGSSCALRSDSVTMTTRDWATFASLTLDRLAYQGVAQIRVNGNNLWTAGTTNTGNLTIWQRNCGKNCNVDAVFSADGTWIADCDSAAWTRSVGVSLLSLYTPPVAGPVVLTGSQPSLDFGKAGTVTIEVIRANTADSGATLNIYKEYSCCSAFTATAGSACP